MLVILWAWFNLYFIQECYLFILLIHIHFQPFVLMNKVKKYICGKVVWIFMQLYE